MLCLTGAGKKGAEGEKGTVKSQKTPEELKALEQFNKITEAASALMDVGEMDIYSAVREELQRAADAFKDDDDMFADEDNAKVRSRPIRNVISHVGMVGLFACLPQIDCSAAH